VQRDPAAEQALAANAGKPAAASKIDATANPGVRVKAPSVQGVYLMKEDHGKQRAIFVPVTTGVTGATDIEVTSGLSPGQTIVTGLYRVLRTLKSGTAIQPDNSIATATT
jgi:HlyD family secretion protein